MLKLRRVDHLPDASIEGGIALLNKLDWNITYGKVDQVWFVWAGEKPLLETNSREAVEAFLYGLALAHADLPDEILERLRELTGE